MIKFKKLILNNVATNLIQQLITMEINKVDFKDIRNGRQCENDIVVYSAIKENDQKAFHDNINKEKYKRTLKDKGLTHEVYWKRMRECDKCADFASMLFAKNASRQGSKDEKKQLETCNEIAKNCGILIKNLTATGWRPTKDGRIVSNNDMRTENIKKIDCLKSFDGEISGKFHGYIAAKVTFGAGGHQDNVFEEMGTIAEWWKTHRSNSEKILIVLIDTDLDSKFDDLKKKYTKVDNVKIFNHVSFQQYMIDTY